MGNVQFDVLNELMKDVANATIIMQHQSILDLVYTLKTAADGTAMLYDIPEGRYSFNISSSGALPYSSTFIVQPGVTTTVPVALELDLVKIEWNVTPIKIEDRYNVQISQTFETNIPTPVLVTEPPSITIPELSPGQIFNGEFSVTNYGLIALDNVKASVATNFEDYDIEVMASIVPKRIGPMERIAIPYRVTRRPLLASTDNNIYNEVKSYGGSCFKSVSICEISGTVVICPNTSQETEIAKTTRHYLQIEHECNITVSNPEQTIDGLIKVIYDPKQVEQKSGYWLIRDPIEISTSLSSENPCECKSDGTVVGTCKECKDKQVIDSPDKELPSDGITNIGNNILSAISDDLQSKIGPISIKPDIAINKSIKRCCGEKGWRIGSKSNFTVTLSGNISKSQDKEVSANIRYKDIVAGMKLAIIKANLNIKLSGSGAIIVDSDPCETGCNMQSELSISSDVSGNISTPEILKDLVYIHGGIEGKIGNVTYSDRCGVSKLTGCIGPVDGKVDVFYLGGLLSSELDIPLIPATCF